MSDDHPTCFSPHRCDRRVTGCGKNSIKLMSLLRTSELRQLMRPWPITQRGSAEHPCQRPRPGLSIQYGSMVRTPSVSLSALNEETSASQQSYRKTTWVIFSRKPLSHDYQLSPLLTLPHPLTQSSFTHLKKVHAAECYRTLAAGPSIDGGISVRADAWVGALGVPTVSFSADPHDG